MKHDIRLLFGPCYPDIMESEILMKKYSINLPKTRCQSLFQKMIQSEQSSDQAVLHFQLDGDTFDGTYKKGCYLHVKPPKAKGIRVRGEWSEAGGQTLLSLKYSREHLSPLGVLFYFLIFTAVWFFAKHSLDNVPVILFLSGLLTLIITGIWDLAYWFLPAYIKSRNYLKKYMRTCIERLQYAVDKENKSPVGH